MDHERSLKELKETLQAEQRAGVQLLSIPQLCQELGMGKNWIYRRLRRGEIPSTRLGRSIKVRHDELEEYLERHHYPERPQALQEVESPPHEGALWTRGFSKRPK